jgi:hypothetical protein
MELRRRIYTAARGEVEGGRVRVGGGVALDAPLAGEQLRDERCEKCSEVIPAACHSRPITIVIIS